MSRRSLPATTVKPGDAVAIHLTGRADERINTWGGMVLAVDGVAVRLAAAWYRFSPWSNTAEGQKVDPWGREMPAVNYGVGQGASNDRVLASALDTTAR